MHYRIFLYIRNVYLSVLFFVTTGIAQEANTDEDSKPVILYPVHRNSMR